MQEKEIWREIPNFRGVYEASNMGRIRSVDRTVECKEWSYTRKGCILKPAMSNGKYLSVRLSCKGIAKTWSVHVLIAITFLGHIPNGYDRVVDHINGNKTDNRVKNLRILSMRRNNIAWRLYAESNCDIGITFVYNKWVAVINVNGERVYIGRFDDKDKAQVAFLDSTALVENGLSPKKYLAEFSSKKTGVSFNNQKGKWDAYIDKDYKRYYIGRFNTEEEAIEARIKAEEDIGVFINNKTRGA